MTVIRQIDSSDKTSTNLLEICQKTDDASTNSLLRKDSSSAASTDFPSIPADDTAESPSFLDIVKPISVHSKVASLVETASICCPKDIVSSSKDGSVISHADNAVISTVDVDIVAATPPSVMRQTTFDYGCLVTSKSRMAGLKSKQSSKLKRLYPDSSLFIKRILKYHPPQVVLKEGFVTFYGTASHAQLSSDHEELPPTFKNAIEMRKLFSPILLAEGISALKQEFLSNSDTSGFWTRTSMPLQLLVCKCGSHSYFEKIL